MSTLKVNTLQGSTTGPDFDNGVTVSSGNLTIGRTTSTVGQGVKLDVVGSVNCASVVLTGSIFENVYTITDGAAFEIDPKNGSVQLITLGASRTPKGTNFVAGQSVTLMIDDGTAYAITWTDTTFGASGVTWVDAYTPTLATTGYTVVQLWKVSTKVYGSYVGTVA